MRRNHSSARPALLAADGSRMLGRRRFLTVGAAAIATVAATPAKSAISSLMCPPQVGTFAGSTAGGEGSLMSDPADEDYSGKVPNDGPGMRRFKMYNSRVGETYDREFVQNGQYVQDALDEFTHIMRDWREKLEKPIDPELLDTLWKIWRKAGSDKMFSLTSGYRSPKTNASLAGAATNSQHMKGKAADVVLPGVSHATIQNIAESLGVGGVGRYSNFTHVDTGPVRGWSG